MSKRYNSKINKVVQEQVQKALDAQNVTNPRAKRFIDTPKNVTDGLRRYTQDVGKWRRAVLAAESEINPSRTEYYRLLKDVTLDNHLCSILEQRKNSALCREVVFYKKDGTKDEENTAIFQKEWFDKLLCYALDAKYYGFTLVDFGPLVDDNFPSITTIQRQYVKPELGIVVPDTAAISGIAIDDPKYSKWNLFIGETHDLGILMKAAPWALWKKTITAYWSEYCEKFGMPLRIGKTNVHDEALKANMDEALRTMGAAFHATLNIDDEIQVLETFNTAAYDIYDKFIDRANSEMSKLILTQTGTTDEKSFVGSANVHEDQLSKLVESDVKSLRFFLNEKLIPFLNNLGFSLDGYFDFEYEQRVSAEEKAKMIASFMPYMTFKKEWLEETFEVEIESITDQPGGADVKKSITNYQNITNSYAHVCLSCGGYHNEATTILFTDGEQSDLIQGILIGIYTVDSLPEWYYVRIAESFAKQVAEGFGTTIDKLTYGSADYNLLTELTHNIYAFSAAKTYQQIIDISALVDTIGYDYAEFMKQASSVFENYNRNWLTTELITAKASARQAYLWKKIKEREQALPYLEYSTVGDARVRPEHAELDGIIRPVNDAFWRSYFPPNGWRCRCTTNSHEDVENVTPMGGFKQPKDVPDLFLFNPGEDKIVFSPEHPYFKVREKDKAKALKNFNLPIPSGQ